MKKTIIGLTIGILLIAPKIAFASMESDINGERAWVGLPPLTLDCSLQRSAKAKDDDMIKQNYFAHVNPQGKGFDTILIKMKIKYSVAGEILAEGYNPGNDLMLAWMNSSTHRALIIDQDFTRVGCYYENGLAACHFAR